MSVKPREGTGTNPLKYGPIKSISVGSIYLRSRYDGPVDSYQEHDIERYCTCTMQGSLLRPSIVDISTSVQSMLLVIGCGVCSPRLGSPQKACNH